MTEETLKLLLYTGIKSLILNNKYYYTSSVSNDYNRWTEEGERAVLEYITSLVPAIKTIHHEQLDSLAREITLKELKTSPSQEKE